MPTGYTHKIAEGISFEQFALNCARAFGACITLRDESADTPIPERFEPSNHYAKKLEEVRERIQVLEKLTMPEIQAKADEFNKKVLDDFDRRVRENQELREKYEAMLEKVKAWVPPSTEHVGLKNFMIEQITTSIAFDCSYSPAKPVAITPEQWFSDSMKSANCDIDYYTKENEAEIERASQRSGWVKQLRDSLKA